MGETMRERLRKRMAIEVSSIVGFRVKADDFGTIPLVRALLDELREPDEAMITAGYQPMSFEEPERALPELIWQAMIDAASK